MNEKEKTLLILEESQNSFNECKEQLKEITETLLKCELALSHAETLLNRVLNEEKNEGNIHKDCEYYNEKHDSCSNYMMGKLKTNSTTVSKKWSIYCMMYSCANCPKREGYQCKNTEWYDEYEK